MCQIASFYAGAMAEARNIELSPVADRVGGLDLVLIGANDPAALVRHTEECRERGYPFAADPSQQLARMEGPEISQLIEGATYLMTNDYEHGLLLQKTGWTDADLLARVQVRVTTCGADGVRIARQGEPELHVPAAPEVSKVDPTGVGDAFRSGFLAGRSWGLGLERSAQVGSLLATYSLETVGPQEYVVKPVEFVERLGGAYGADAADEVRVHFAG
jgi:adenosine kinase